MITITVGNIIIFLVGFIAGGGVALLTQRYLYGKRMYVSGLPHKEESFTPRKVDTELPPVEADRFSNMLRQINTHDEFAESYSKAAREHLR